MAAPTPIGQVIPARTVPRNMKPVVSPDGLVFISIAEAARYYGKAKSQITVAVAIGRRGWRPATEAEIAQVLGSPSREG